MEKVVLGLLFAVSVAANVVTSVRHDGVRYDFVDVYDTATIERFISDGNVSVECERHFTKLLKALEKGELWALQLVDSVTKFPDGILMGRPSVPGHFDECVQVRSDDLVAKHCMVSAKLLLNTTETPTSPQFQIGLTYGICLPSSCTVDDINKYVGMLNVVPNVRFDNITDRNCSTIDFLPLRTEDWAAIGVLAVVAALTVASTIYDLIQKVHLKKETTNRLFSSFSLYTNGKTLFRVTRGNTQLNCVYGIRFLSIAWVILGHSYITYAFSASINLIEIPRYLTMKSLSLVNNAYVAVDTFFFLSGLLACLVFFRDIAKKGFFDVPVAYIHRYIRLTPPLALVLLMQASLISRLGNGPFWNKSMGDQERSCRDTWWTTLLYVQNYLKPESLCLGQSWYLSADMQMFWLSPLILYPIYLWPVFAPFFLGLLLLLAVAANFTIAYQNDLDPTLSMALVHGKVTQFEIDYIVLETRLAPWLIGLATGYVVCGITAKKIRVTLPKTLAALIWVLTLVDFSLCVFGVIRFLSHEYTYLESALYLSLHRVGWALGLSWMIIACVSGYGGPINDFLSMDIFQPLAKLSYCNFLIHMSLQNYRLFSSRINQYIRQFDLTYMFFADISLSFLLSIPVTLMFELPFIGIDRYLFENVRILPYPRRPRPKQGHLSKNLTENNLNKPETRDDNLEKGQDNPAFVKESNRL